METTANRNVPLSGELRRLVPTSEGCQSTVSEFESGNTVERRYPLESDVRVLFIGRMLFLRSERLPEGDSWAYEIKFDGYRALAIKSDGNVHLRSRNDNDFNRRYPAIGKALVAMPDDTVIDGEVVALDGDGKPSFNQLQNSAAGADLHFFIFDLLILKGQDLMGKALMRVANCSKSTFSRSSASRFDVRRYWNRTSKTLSNP
jgi:hypothetical protein